MKTCSRVGAMPTIKCEDPGCVLRDKTFTLDDIGEILLMTISGKSSFASAFRGTSVTGRPAPLAVASLVENVGPAVTSGLSSLTKACTDPCNSQVEPEARITLLRSMLK